MEIVNKAFLAIVNAIYRVAASAFQLFMILANGQIIDTNDIDIQNLTMNFYIIIGVIMLFVIAFALLKSMVNPDDQKSGTAMIKKVIINLMTSALIMAVLPTVFTFAFDFQTSIINRNVIGKFFGYGSINTNGTPGTEIEEVKTSAFRMVNGVYTAFFNVNPDSEQCQGKNIAACQASIKSGVIDGSPDEKTLAQVMEEVENDGNFNKYSAFANYTIEDSRGDKTIDFNFLLSLIAGLVLIYVGISFCFDMAVRMVKLVFYQIIAPMPIFLRILPDGKLSGIFNQWTKVTITCYLEVFIRIFVFYFCIFLCNRIIDAELFTNISNSYSGFLGLLAKAFVLMGIVTFMRQAPKLFSEVTGLDSGNMKLGIRQKLADGGLFAASAVVGSTLTSGVKNLTHSVGRVKSNWSKADTLTKKAGLIAGAVGTTAAGITSGAYRGTKAGLKAQNLGDAKNVINQTVSEVERKRKEREVYKGTHGNSISGYAKGKISGYWDDLQTWAGINKVDAGEADRYTMAYKAFDSAHSQAEAAYKGKDDHDKMKTELNNLKAEITRMEQVALGNDYNNYSQLLRIKASDRTAEQNKMVSAYEQRITQQFSDYENTKALKVEAEQRKQIHEATEMRKKITMQVDAATTLVVSKMKYSDLADEIFTDDMYEDFRASNLAKNGDPAAADNLIEKIRNNKEILASDLEGISLNSFESFLDAIGTKANHIANAKSNAVRHSQALAEEKKGDNK